MSFEKYASLRTPRNKVVYPTLLGSWRETLSPPITARKHCREPFSSACDYRLRSRRCKSRWYLPPVRLFEPTVTDIGLDRSLPAQASHHRCVDDERTRCRILWRDSVVRPRSAVRRMRADNPAVRYQILEAGHRVVEQTVRGRRLVGGGVIWASTTVCPHIGS